MQKPSSSAADSVNSLAASHRLAPLNENVSVNTYKLEIPNVFGHTEPFEDYRKNPMFLKGSGLNNDHLRRATLSLNGDALIDVAAKMLRVIQ